MSAATPSPTLESVQQAFDHWRATRGKRTRTPDSLQRQAAALCLSHRASHICRALKINDIALKRWGQKDTSSAALLPATPAALVELPAEPATAMCADSLTGVTSSISISLGDAIELHVQGRFTLEQILCATRKHQQEAGS